MTNWEYEELKQELKDIKGLQFFIIGSLGILIGICLGIVILGIGIL